MKIELNLDVINELSIRLVWPLNLSAETKLPDLDTSELITEEMIRNALIEGVDGVF